MGSFFKSESKPVTDKVARDAYRTVKPAITQAVSGGLDFYNQYYKDPAYTGQRVAALNPFQTNSANALGNFSSQFTPMATNALTNLAGSNIGTGMNFGGNAENIFARASGDPTQQIMDQAGMYANNPYTQGIIDAASRDVSRNLFEQQLPGIDRAATGAGNLNSTRAGVESAIASRGAADRLADISSSIRSQFFGKGLDMAQNQYNQNLSNMMNANADILRAGQFGADSLGAAQNMAGTGFNQGQAAGGLFQMQNQNELDAQKAFFDESMANRANTLQLLSGIASGGQGFRSAAGVSQSPSTASQIGGLMYAAAPFFSDRRMKQNISQVGKLASGLPLYRFEYKPEFKEIAGHGIFVGVMADEAEKLIPEAVSVHANGYKYVDYAKVR
jgi:hypothetical protein